MGGRVTIKTSSDEGNLCTYLKDIRDVKYIYVCNEVHGEYAKKTNLPSLKEGSVVVMKDGKVGIIRDIKWNYENADETTFTLQHGLKIKSGASEKRLIEAKQCEHL